MNWYGYEQVFGPWCALQNISITKVEQEGQSLKVYVTETGNQVVGVFHFGFAMAHRYFWDHYVIFASQSLRYPLDIPYPNLYRGTTEGPTKANNALHPFPCILGDLVDYMLLTNRGHINVAATAQPTFEFLGERKTIPCIEAPKDPC